jgi:diaminopimelate epimerase
MSNGEVKLRLNDVSGIKEDQEGYVVDTGSPHLVKFVPDLGELDVAGSGRQIRHLERFGPSGINVNFVQRTDDPELIAVRTYERGVEDETLSCGTGVTAAAICAYHLSGTDILSYTIRTAGGLLKVSFSPGPSSQFTGVYLTGPFSHVYEGTCEC